MERLSGLDASFLYLETPQAHMHVALLLLLDPAGLGGADLHDQLVALFRARVHAMPELRRRIRRVPFDLHRPLWEEQPGFDVLAHVRRAALPPPGDAVALAEMVGRVASRPLPRDRPLWEAWVVEGLAGGLAALLVKVHHAVVDGAAGASLLLKLAGLSPAAPHLAPPALPSPAPEATPGDPADELGLLLDAVAERAREPRRLATLARHTARVFGDVARRRADPAIQAGGTPLTAPRTPFSEPISPRRAVAFARLPLAGVKAIRRATGTKVNDVVLGLCSGALRRYLAGRHALPDRPLVAVVPVSVREGPVAAAGGGSNRLSAIFTSLATHVEDPLERLQLIARVTRGSKEEHAALGSDLLGRWADLAPPRLLRGASRAYSRLRLGVRRPVHNLIISNVPGPRSPVYLGQAEILAAYPLGPPMEGAALNVTVLSYREHVDVGFIACREIAPDLHRLAAALSPAYDELARAAGIAAADAHPLPASPLPAAP